MILFNVAIDEIFDFLPDPRNYIEFEKDLKTRRAVERNIEILGEAMHRILKIDSEFNIANARRIVDTRNRVIHGNIKENHHLNAGQPFLKKYLGSRRCWI
ncbi:MAG: DUF86 domain-containing protein, partial [Candidatus Electrothrix sp. MAN1_4]|nr:DUF86 domain-containing protein [Candidatus Electrothrix sp. MAN1_4]